MVKIKLSIPESFFKEETRCGYTVSRKMKEIWAVQLDLFAEFDRVCRKYGIIYIASGGTMLGAVRHHGYIPWDDDIDLMLTRDQYDKLCQVAPNEFKHPYFFQTEKTDVGFMRGFARLRNSETTGIQKQEISYHLTYNQGIFIDIFPMDNIPNDKSKYERQCKKYSFYNLLFSYLNVIETGIVNDEVSLLERSIRKLLSSSLGIISKKMRLCDHYYEKAQRECMRYNCEKSEYISLLSFQMDNLKHAIRNSDMDHIIYVDFEFLKMPIIANYDEHLKLKYGKYLTPLQNPNYHGEIIFDTNHSYKDYFALHTSN